MCHMNSVALRLVLWQIRFLKPALLWSLKTFVLNRAGSSPTRKKPSSFKKKPADDFQVRQHSVLVVFLAILKRCANALYLAYYAEKEGTGASGFGVCEQRAPPTGEQTMTNELFPL